MLLKNIEPSNLFVEPKVKISNTVWQSWIRCHFLIMQQSNALLIASISIPTLIATELTSSQIHDVYFSPIPACAKHVIPHQRSETSLLWYVTFDWRYLFICSFRPLSLVSRVLRSLRRLLIMRLQLARLSTLRWAQCFTLFHYPINRKTITKPCPPADSLPFPHAGVSPLWLFIFFFSLSLSAELLHSLHTVYVGGIVK